MVYNGKSYWYSTPSNNGNIIHNWDNMFYNNTI